MHFLRIVLKDNFHLYGYIVLGFFYLIYGFNFYF